MILVADSGATKTDWAAIAENGTRSPLSSSGLNPNYITNPALPASEIGKVAQDTGNADAVRQIFFYGAGCSSAENKQTIATLLKKHFPNATIEVHTDLLGACRAACGEGNGIVGILGTGSNSCVYKNGAIVENIPSTGYMLGDEGSGTYIGKSLLKQYLTGFMPDNLARQFETEHPYPRSQFMNMIYHHEAPNKLFASIMPFAINHRHDDFVHSLALRCFDDFFQNQILKYNTAMRDLYLVGSVAFMMSEEIGAVAAKHGYTIKNISKKPIEGLIQFHSKKR